MRILFLSHYDNMYGANRALLELMLGLRQSGEHEPLAVLPAEGELTQRLKSAGIEYYICSMTQWQAIYRDPLSFALKRYKRKKAIAAELNQLYEHFKDRGIDLIHSNASVIGTGAMLAEKLGCAHVWHIREFAREHYGMRYFYPEATVRHYYEKADCLIAISDAIKEHYQRLYPGAKLRRIYDGVECRGEERPRENTDGIVRFCYVGYLFPKKNQLELLQAAAELKAEGESGFRVTLAGGGDAAYEKKLRAFAKEHLQETAEFAGFVKDIPSLLGSCDVGVIASDHEGFGLVTVEYMLAGLPVIGYESGATPEIVKDGLSGLLYRDREGLKAAMRRMMREEQTRRSMGEAGRRRAVECFLAERNTAEVRKLYGELDANRKRG